MSLTLLGMGYENIREPWGGAIIAQITNWDITFDWMRIFPRFLVCDILTI